MTHLYTLLWQLDGSLKNALDNGEDKIIEDIYITEFTLLTVVEDTPINKITTLN